MKRLRIRTLLIVVALLALPLAASKHYTTREPQLNGDWIWCGPFYIGVVRTKGDGAFVLAGYGHSKPNAPEPVYPPPY